MATNPVYILATDCGSTTTKAILIKNMGSEYRLVVRGEAPTTVEAPFEDVTKGVINSFIEVEELSGLKFLEGEKIIKPYNGKEGVDLYVSTSSAGGGLQMMVMGVVKVMSAESAERAALGAGAIVVDTIATNDNRQPYEKIELIRKIRPDMILLSGGTDGGTISHVVEMAEYIRTAEPKARFGLDYKLPVIYAGNKEARKNIEELLKEKVSLTITENLRPTLERENLLPARHKIHELFLEHVMMQAPGYKKLMAMVDAKIMPTPLAVGLLMEKVAKERNINLIGVDIGGATTDVFSVFGGIFNRTVSANLGMSYSISNVLKETTFENIARWIPFKVDPVIVRNNIKNKMIRPTTIPQDLEDLIIEQAVAREALRLALLQHKSFATTLKGVHKERTMSEIDIEEVETLIDLTKLNLVIGSGGVLSHSPRRIQSFLMMIDAYQPLYFTEFTVDSIFMMPHLGVLSTVNEKAAFDVFYKDCLVPLGTAIAPKNFAKDGETVCQATIKFSKGTEEKYNLQFGNIYLFPESVEADIIILPLKGLDFGEGKNKKVHKKVKGGVCGIIIDLRGRPLKLDIPDREKKLSTWFKSLSLYPS
ncbi:MAG: glutamate mutase L [Planctomycetota bacterium]